MDKILITGGSGFIGTNLINAILDKYIIMNLDIQRPKIQDHYCFWENVDINNYEELEKKIIDFNPDYIIHLAARCDLNGNHIDDYKTNIVGVQNLLNVSQKVMNLKKIIVTSSMLVCRPGYYPKNVTDYYPSTIYGESKVLTEKSVWETDLDCDVAIVRPTSIWGPWFEEPYFNFFKMIIEE